MPARLLVCALLLPASVAAMAVDRPATARPQQAGGNEAIVLGRQNVLKGRRSGMVEVVVPRRASLDVHLLPTRRSGPNPSIALQGRGRSIGFALAPVDLPGDLKEGIVTAARFAGCRSRGCRPSGRIHQFMWPYGIGPGPHRRVLAPGRYRLYLIADHAPARISFRLRGLRGRTSLRIDSAADVDVRSPKVRVDLRGDRRVLSAGSTYRARGRGFVVSTLWAYGRAFAGGAWGLCSYRAPLRVPGGIGYGPGCSAVGGGAAGYTSGGAHVRGFSVALIATHERDPAGLLTRRAVGAWLASPGRTHVVGAQAFSLRL